MLRNFVVIFCDVSSCKYDKSEVRYECYLYMSYYNGQFNRYGFHLYLFVAKLLNICPLYKKTYKPFIIGVSSYI